MSERKDFPLSLSLSLYNAAAVLLSLVFRLNSESIRSLRDVVFLFYPLLLLHLSFRYRWPKLTFFCFFLHSTEFSPFVGCSDRTIDDTTPVSYIPPPSSIENMVKGLYTLTSVPPPPLFFVCLFYAVQKNQTTISLYVPFLLMKYLFIFFGGCSSLLLTLKEKRQENAFVSW